MPVAEDRTVTVEKTPRQRRQVLVRYIDRGQFEVLRGISPKLRNHECSGRVVDSDLVRPNTEATGLAVDPRLTSHGRFELIDEIKLLRCEGNNRSSAVQTPVRSDEADCICRRGRPTPTSFVVHESYESALGTIC